MDDDYGEALIQVLTWLKQSLERMPEKNRRYYIESTRHWSLRARMPFLFTLFLSDLWILPFSRLHGTQTIWLIGEVLLSGDIPALIEVLIGPPSTPVDSPQAAFTS
jgi:hypothetical protein